MVAKYLYDAWGNCTISSETTNTVVANANPIRYRGYYYDTDTGFYYLQSRYYDPAIGRFINADALVSTGQGLLGNNMFAYCRNNPVSRVDISGRDDMECTDFDNNALTDDEHLMVGGGNPGSGPTTGSSTGNGGGGAQTPAIQIAPAPGGGYMIVAGDSSEEKHELHHIVERCQMNKSGFTEENIEGYRNKVSIPQSVHRKISGYYSSKTDLSEGQRVRDWLAGQSFDIQQNFGMKILAQMWNEVFGENGS